MNAPRVFTRENATDFLDSAVEPALWTALIPAAGRGSRLSFDQPKILYPIAGRTILEWLVERMKPFCQKFVFVLSHEGLASVKQAALPLLAGRAAFAVQNEPIGMADAIRCGLPEVATRNTLIVWGDQVAVKPESLEFLMRIHQGAAQPAATCPTLWRDRPYIHFERSESGRVSRVLQAREGDRMPAQGESDSGVFLFRTDALREYLPRLLESPECIGAKTRELNFLPIFPLLGEQLITAPIMTEPESVGVNSPADVAYLEDQLRCR
ncbi:MAG TPA: NTP transferase domain-containing protein [Bryobacteraceae bacterium]|nr:NTP transferase domain-containing protein [Bryobacteraceae bacterium]